jgi:hypothetical protein
MGRKISLRSDEFAILVGNEVEWRQIFTPENFLRATKVVFQRYNGVPDDEIMERWIKSFKRPVT